MTPNELMPLRRMWERVQVTKTDSDTALFYDLMFLGELVTKLVVAGTVSTLEEDREHQRYGLEHALVRADSIGAWVTVLAEGLGGPASQLLAPEAIPFKREMTQRWSVADEAWQRLAVERLEAAALCTGASRPDLPGKVPLQHWFQTFVWLRNRTRGHGAPTGEACGQMASTLEASLQLLTSNLSLFQHSWAFLKRNLSGKYRVTLLGGSPVPFEHLKRDPNLQLEDGVYVAIAKRLFLVPLAYTDVDLSDFFVANGNYRGEEFEALSYLSDVTRQIDGSRYSLAAKDMPASGTAAGPVLDMVGQTFSNIPPPIQDYVGRPALEAELTKLLVDDRHPIVTLTGRGGVGKTSLALQVLRRLADDGPFFALIWFSARDIDLLSYGPKRVQADVLSQDDIAKQFVELMNPAGSANKGFDNNAYLAGALNGQLPVGRFLFVFDNFETVRDPVDVFNWIDNCIRTPNKVVITSRFRDFRGDYPIEVRGMARAEFMELAAATAKRIGVENILDERYLDELYEESDGHPYVVRILLGEMAVHKRQPSVERVLASREDILDALFERSFTAISPAAQRVFLTLCSWRSPAPRLGIEAALTRPANERMDVGKAIDVLERSSLIEVVGGPSMSQQFVRVPVAAAVFGRKKLTVSSMKAAIEADSEILRSFGAIKASDVARGIGPRLDRLTRSLAVRAQAGEDVSEGIAVLEFVARNYAEAWLRVADIYDESPDGLGATLHSVDALKHYLEARPEDISGWRRLAETSARAGDAMGELQALFQVADSASATPGDRALAANRFNGLAAEGKLNVGTDARRAMAGRLRKLLERHIDEADATDFSRLAWLSLHTDDQDAARAYTLRGLVMDPFNKHCRSLAMKLRLPVEKNASEANTDPRLFATGETP